MVHFLTDAVKDKKEKNILKRLRKKDKKEGKKIKKGSNEWIKEMKSQKIKKEMKGKIVFFRVVLNNSF